MAQYDVTASAITTVDATNLLIQNLGPGNLFVGSTAVTAGDGLQVPPGGSLKLVQVDKVGMIGDDACDVRTVVGGDSVSPVPQT